MTENLEKNHVLSSRKRRIAALLIDHYIMVFLMVASVFLSLGTDFMDRTDFSDLISRMLPALLIGFFLYFAKDSIKGSSPGKWIMGIMVRDEKNPMETPSFGRLFVRNLFLIIWPVEGVVLVSGQDKKRLGDRTSGSIVVKNPNKGTLLPRILTLAGIGMAYVAFIFFFVAGAMKNSDAYRVAIHEIEQNESILSETGGIKGYGMIPTGNVSITNGNGQARLNIKVLGKTKDINVHAYLTKASEGEWKLIELNQ